LLTPDDVQGHYPTLREAVLHDNWPKLGAARGASSSRWMKTRRRSPPIAASARRWKAA
jgi:hypothetical protein